MSTLKRNKRKMYYSTILGRKPVYDRDEKGNTIYIEIDGEMIPQEGNGYETLYSTPVEFKANVSSTLASSAFKPFGVDKSSNMATICCDKEYVPLRIGDIVWIKSKPQFEDKEKTIPIYNSADWVVKGVADVGLTNDLYLLQRLNGSDD